MFFLSDFNNAEFKRGKDKRVRKKKRSLSSDAKQIRATTKTVTEPIKIGQKIWSTANHTSREIRTWKKFLTNLSGLKDKANELDRLKRQLAG